MNRTLARGGTALMAVFTGFFILMYVVQSAAFLTQPNLMGLAVTLDVVVVLPLIYWALVRPTTIPQTTVLPILFLGVLVGSNLLPESQQTYLNLVKHGVLPLVELFVVGWIGYKTYRIVRQYRAANQQHTDVFSTLKAVCNQLTTGRPAALMATELAVLYYGLFSWKKPIVQVPHFSYHKRSGVTTLLGAVIFMLLIETFVVHLLLMRWNVAVAWVVFGLSAYGGLQLLAIAKSIAQRPILLDADHLRLRYGIAGELEVPLEAIKTVERYHPYQQKAEGIPQFTLAEGLEQPNLRMHLSQPQTWHKLYGGTQTVDAILFTVDDPDAFLAILQARLA